MVRRLARTREKAVKMLTDVDLLQQMYYKATARLAPKDAESAINTV